MDREIVDLLNAADPIRVLPVVRDISALMKSAPDVMEGVLNHWASGQRGELRKGIADAMLTRARTMLGSAPAAPRPEGAMSPATHRMARKMAQDEIQQHIGHFHRAAARIAKRAAELGVEVGEHRAKQRWKRAAALSGAAPMPTGAPLLPEISAPQLKKISPFMARALLIDRPSLAAMSAYHPPPAATDDDDSKKKKNCPTCGQAMPAQPAAGAPPLAKNYIGALTAAVNPFDSISAYAKRQGDATRARHAAARAAKAAACPTCGQAMPAQPASGAPPLAKNYIGALTAAVNPFDSISAYAKRQGDATRARHAAAKQNCPTCGQAMPKNPAGEPPAMAKIAPFESSIARFATRPTPPLAAILQVKQQQDDDYEAKKKKNCPTCGQAMPAQPAAGAPAMAKIEPEGGLPRRLRVGELSKVAPQSRLHDLLDLAERHLAERAALAERHRAELSKATPHDRHNDLAGVGARHLADLDAMEKRHLAELHQHTQDALAANGPPNARRQNRPGKASAPGHVTPRIEAETTPHDRLTAPASSDTWTAPARRGKAFGRGLAGLAAGVGTGIALTAWARSHGQKRQLSAAELKQRRDAAESKRKKGNIGVQVERYRGPAALAPQQTLNPGQTKRSLSVITGNRPPGTIGARFEYTRERHHMAKIAPDTLDELEGYELPSGLSSHLRAG